MSSKKLHRSDIAERILSLIPSSTTDKDFLHTCNISNPTFITTLRNGENKNPGSKYLSKIVRGTGVSGTWLLTGEGEKFEPRRNQESSIAAEPTVAYISKLVEEIEQGGALRSEELPRGSSLTVAKLLVKLLEAEHGG